MKESRRQTVLLGGAAALAAAAGAGVAWWRSGRASSQAPAGPDELWTKRFSRPEGGELAMAGLRGRPLVINFWATWCPPCLKEMPQIDRFHRAFEPQGWQVVGIALDQAQPVREFLARLPVGFPIALGGLEGSDMAMRLGNSRGVLPFTVIIDAQGQPVWRHLGETSFDELSAQVKTLPSAAKS